VEFCSAPSPLSEAKALAEQIRAEVKHIRILRADGQEYVGEVTVSLGVAAAQTGDSLEALIERADEVMYQAKRGGRNQVSVAQGTPKSSG